MATFTVDGKSVTVEKNQKLIRFLRETLPPDLREGRLQRRAPAAPARCIIDGKPTKACIPHDRQARGRQIAHRRGALPTEKSRSIPTPSARRARCSAASASPGMVICGQGAARRESRTPRARRRPIAIRNNICRCTGYVKIIDGILLAGEALPRGRDSAPAADDWQLGSRVHRLDVEEKVLGYGQYPDDVVRRRDVLRRRGAQRIRPRAGARDRHRARRRRCAGRRAAS